MIGKFGGQFFQRLEIVVCTLRTAVKFCFARGGCGDNVTV
jgi:hypothetical protein